MRVLIMVRDGKSAGLLVELHRDELVEEVKALISKRRNSAAMVKAITGGEIREEVHAHNHHLITADLILSYDRASWVV